MNVLGRSRTTALLLYLLLPLQVQYRRAAKVVSWVWVVAALPLSWT